MVACHGEQSSVKTPQGIIVVSMDTVRWDHTSLGSYSRDTTPNLARLARQPGAIQFDRAYTAASWSLPAYASLFTGQNVLTHGVGFTQDTIAPTTRTLAEVLQAYGYQTRAHCSGPHLVAGQGFDRGFDAYEHHTNALPLTTQVSAALDWLAHERDEQRPFFLFLQGYDAHFPYATPALMSELFAEAPIERPGGACAQSCGAARRNNGWRCVPQIVQEQGTGILSEDGLRHVVDHYDSAVYYADFQLGRLLHHLEEMDLMDDTMVVVLSDHGEGLGEEGRVGHDWDCGENIFHVPLVIRMPTGAPPLRQESVVSLSGLAPTLLEAVGIDPPVGSDGQSFTPLLDAQRDVDAQASSASKQCYTVRTPTWRYTERWQAADWSPLPPTLQRDGVGEDQIAAHPEVATALAGTLASWPRGMDIDAINKRMAEDDAVLQQALRDGGYWSAPPQPGQEP